MLRKSIAVVTFAVVAVLSIGVSYAGNSCMSGGKCIWGQSGVTWKVVEDKGALLLEVTVAGCKNRAKTVKGIIEAKIPECKSGACDHSDGCPFAVDGAKFEINNSDLGFTVRVTAEKKEALDKFRTLIEAKMKGKGDHHGEGEKKGGCGCQHGK